jgi:sugar O-acyltransferase (sialic acid O-acetyltransferase NeuD family)
MNLRGFVDEKDQAPETLGFVVLRELPRGHIDDGGLVAVAVGDNCIRERIIASLLARFPSATFPPIVHPSASVSGFATVGAGSFVAQGAVVGPLVHVGVGCIVHGSSVVGHGSGIEDFSFVSAGALLGGDVSIGHAAFVGMGAIVKHGVKVGEGAVLGAGSLLLTDLDPLVVAYGSPARPVRTREWSDPYL